MTGGFDRPNFSWLYVVPMAAAVMLDLRGAWIWLGITLAAVVGFWLLPEFGITLESAVPQHLERGQALFSRVSAILALGLVATAFVIFNRRAKGALEFTNRELALETKYVQLLQHAAESANEALDLEQAMEQSVLRICTVMDWRIGQAYALDDNGRLQLTRGWIEDKEGQFTSLRDLTTEGFAAGEGLPGRAMASLSPEFVAPTSSMDTDRAKLAEMLGIRSAIALPVIADGAVIAVLEFGTSEELEVDDRLCEVLSHVGMQVGRVAERVSLQARLRQSQKMEAVGQLAAGMAHEINNPMSYVRSNLTHLRLALESAEVTDDQAGLARQQGEWREMIDDSLEGVNRTIAIVGEVKEYARFEGGVSRLSNLNEILETALREVEAKESDEVNFVRSYHESLPTLLCSPEQLHRVFMNLIVNAVQAMRSVGEIELATGIDGSWLWASVEDDGPGIPASHLDGLFDPFFTTRPAGAGTGLGLYVACEIVASHGGEIRVRSDVGCGSRFEVRIPLQAQTPGSSNLV